MSAWAVRCKSKCGYVCACVEVGLHWGYLAIEGQSLERLAAAARLGTERAELPIHAPIHPHCSSSVHMAAPVEALIRGQLTKRSLEDAGGVRHVGHVNVLAVHALWPNEIEANVSVHARSGCRGGVEAPW